MFNSSFPTKKYQSQEEVWFPLILQKAVSTIEKNRFYTKNKDIAYKTYCYILN